MSFPEFDFESEINDIESQVSTYVRTGLDFVRGTGLEGTNSHLIVIDFKKTTIASITNVYMSLIHLIASS